MSGPRLYRVSAVVIRHRNLGETDRIVILLTRERGKVSAVARGAKRPRSKLASGLQLFSHARAQLAAGRSLQVVTQVQLVDAFYHLRGDLARYAHASYVAELVDVLTEEESADPEVFDLVLTTLRALDSGGDASTLVRGFELKLLRHLGYGPELHTCVSCGVELDRGRGGFSASQGGSLCPRCSAGEGGIASEPGVLAAMRDLASIATEELATRKLRSAVAQQVDRIMRAYVDYRVERPLRSAAFLSR